MYNCLSYIYLSKWVNQYGEVVYISKLATRFKDGNGICIDKINFKTMRNLFVTLIILALQISVYAQNPKSITFEGIQKWSCQHPMMMPNGKWTPFYQNEGQNLKSGKITINEKTKEFKVVFNNGETWIIKKITKELIKENDDEYGEVERTIYKGIWSYDEGDAKLVITKTIDKGCITQLYVQYIINEETKLDYYKTAYIFLTNGACIK